MSHNHGAIRCFVLVAPNTLGNIASEREGRDNHQENKANKLLHMSKRVFATVKCTRANGLPVRTPWKPWMQFSCQDPADIQAFLPIWASLLTQHNRKPHVSKPSLNQVQTSPWGLSCPASRPPGSAEAATNLQKERQVEVGILMLRVVGAVGRRGGDSQEMAPTLDLPPSKKMPKG